MSTKTKTTKKPIKKTTKKLTIAQIDKPKIKEIEKFIETLLEATPKQIRDELQPTKLDIVLLAKVDRNNINKERWQENHKELHLTIKRGYDVIENILVKQVAFKNSIGSMFMLKAAFQYRENAIVSENERIVINIGDNNGKNKI